MQTCDCDGEHEPHTCPYDEKINDDYCASCEQQCAADI